MQRMCRHHLREGKVSRIYSNLSDIWYNQLCLHYWEQGQQWQSTCSQDWTWWVPQYQVQSIHQPVVNCKALIRFPDFFLPLHSLTIIFQLLEKSLVSASCSNSTKNCMTSTGCQWVAGLWIVLYHGCRNSAQTLHLYIGTTRKAMLHSCLTAGVTASTPSLTAQESKISQFMWYLLQSWSWVFAWFSMGLQVMVLHGSQGHCFTCWSRDSNLQMLPPLSFISFHHLSPTIILPLTFFTIQKSIPSNVIVTTKLMT